MTDSEVIDELRIVFLGDSNKQREAKDLAIKALEKQTTKKPVLKSGMSTAFVDYADGTGKVVSSPWQDWCCPVCGWFVGQRYNRSQSKPHDQRKSCYCNECGQRIDWGNEE